MVESRLIGRGCRALLLAGLLLCAGCDQLIPANQKMMKDAIAAADQAAQSEEKTWAYVLRMEELTQRLEKTVRQAEVAAQEAQSAAKQAATAASRVEAMSQQTDSSKIEAEAILKQAKEAAATAEAVARRVEQQEGESLQKMLELLRELGYKQ